MIGQIAKLPGENARLDDDRNAASRSRDVATSLSSRRRSRNWLLPDFPGLGTIRGKVANGMFVMLLLVARSSFALGAAVGGWLAGFAGVIIGLAAGWIVGVWIRWSLGVRRSGLTHSLVVRMLERGNNDHPKLLESLVESLRGCRLNAKQCRLIAAAYARATRRLQSCDSSTDHAEILAERDRQILEAAYGTVQPAPISPGGGPLVQRNGLPASLRSKRAIRACPSGPVERSASRATT